MDRCKHVLEVIERNSGKEYKSPAKLGNTPEAKAMQQLYSECKQGEDEFTSLVEEIAEKNEMISSIHKSVLDGTRRRIRSYYWGELQLQKFLSSAESISVFAEKDADTKKARFRVSLEIDGNRASASELEKHNSLLDLPQEDGCVYALNEGAAKEITYTDDLNDAKEKISNGISKKVQLCVLIEQDDYFDEDQYLSKMNGAVKKLMKAYKYVTK